MGDPVAVVTSVLDGIKGKLVEIGVDLVVKLASGQIPDATVRAIGVAHGKWITKNATAAIGVSERPLEDLIQEKSAFYFDGLNEGLNSDD